jgi:hypothetical protein
VSASLKGTKVVTDKWESQLSQFKVLSSQPEIIGHMLDLPDKLLPNLLRKIRQNHSIFRSNWNLIQNLTKKRLAAMGSQPDKNILVQGETSRKKLATLVVEFV